jgi:dihydroxyacetone kinase-like protein
MKKLINQPADVVKEALQGMALAYPDLVKVNFEPNFFLRRDAPVPGMAD